MPTTYYGFNPPWFGGHQNVMSKQSGDRIIINDVLQLLLTCKGERVMRPDWGTIINTSVFDQLDSKLRSSLSADIEDQLDRYETRVDVSASFTQDDDNNTLRIKLSGTFTNQPNHLFEEEIVIPIDRAGK